MQKIKISKAFLLQAAVIAAFSAIAMASSSNKDFNDGFKQGFRDSYNAMQSSLDATPQTLPVDSLEIIPGAAVASID